MVTTMATMAVMSMAIRTAFVLYMLQTKKVISHLQYPPARGVLETLPHSPNHDRNSADPEPKGLEHTLAPGSLSAELAA